jgi:hypothetical protein
MSILQMSHWVGIVNAVKRPSNVVRLKANKWPDVFSGDDGWAGSGSGGRYLVGKRACVQCFPVFVHDVQ